MLGLNAHQINESFHFTFILLNFIRLPFRKNEVCLKEYTRSTFMKFSLIGRFSWLFSLILSGFLLACQNDSPSMDPDPMPKGTEPMPEPPVAHPKNTQYPICPNGFCFKNPSTGGNTIRGLWGSGDKDIWAVGDYGTILHYDGKIWSLVPSPTQANLKAVWGSSYDNVYAIGEQGTLLHYTESLGTWNSLSLGISSTLWGIWGDAPNHIWLVGEQGTLWALDGKTWNWKQIHFLTNSSNETNYDLTGIWGNSAGQIYLVGSQKTPPSTSQVISIQWDGQSWHDPITIWKEKSGYPEILLPRAGIIGFEPNDLFVLISASAPALDLKYEFLYHLQEGNWQWQLASGINLTSDGNVQSIFSDYQNLFGFSPHDIWIPHPNGVFRFRDETHLALITSSLNSSANTNIYASWGRSEKNMWFALDSGGLAHFDGQKIDWNSDAFQGAIAQNVWIQSDNEFWAQVNYSSAHSLSHYKSGTWLFQTQPITMGLWPLDESHAFLQDNQYTLYSFNGSGWQNDSNFDKTANTSKTIRNLDGISSNQVLALTQSALLSYNGSAWQNQKTLYDQLFSPPSSDFSTILLPIFWVNSFHDAWFSGQDCDHLPGEAYCDLEKGSMNRYWLKHSSNLTDVDNKIPVARLVLGFWASDSTHLWILQEGNSSLLFSDGRNILKDGDPTQFGKANIEKEQPLVMWGRSTSDIWLKTKNDKKLHEKNLMGLYHYNGSIWKKKPLPAAFSEDAQLTGSRNGTGIWISEGSVIVHYQPELDKNP